MQNSPGKYLNHTIDEIQKFLSEFKKLVKNKKFVIPQNLNRKDNREFLQKYHINQKKQMEMLLEINVLDFCYSVDDDKNAKERLYIFAKEYELDHWGILEKVSVYIKIVIKTDDYAVIISFHKPKKQIKKLFIEGG